MLTTILTFLRSDPKTTRRSFPLFPRQVSAFQNYFFFFQIFLVRARYLSISHACTPSFAKLLQTDESHEKNGGSMVVTSGGDKQAAAGGGGGGGSGGGRGMGGGGGGGRNKSPEGGGSSSGSGSGSGRGRRGEGSGKGSGSGSGKGKGKGTGSGKRKRHEEEGGKEEYGDPLAFGETEAGESVSLSSVLFLKSDL